MTPGLALAVELLQGNRPDLAEREARRVLAADPESGEAHAVLALALAVRRERAAAVAAAEAAVRLAPEHPLARQALAEVHVRLGHREAAEAAALAALELEPGEPLFHGLLGAALLNRSFRRPWTRGLNERALRAAEAGLALDPEHVTCLLLKAQALVRLGRPEEARLASEAALRLWPDAPGPHAVHGEVELARGRGEQGRARLREALRMDPGDVYAQVHLGVGDPHRRDMAALVLQARKWKPAFHALLVVMVAAAVAGLARGNRWLATLPLLYALAPLWTTHAARTRDRHLLVELAAPGALTRKDWFWAKVSLALWAAFGLGGAALAVWG